MRITNLGMSQRVVEGVSVMVYQPTFGSDSSVEDASLLIEFMSANLKVSLPMFHRTSDLDSSADGAFQRRWVHIH